MTSGTPIPYPPVTRRLIILTDAYIDISNSTVLDINKNFIRFPVIKSSRT